MRIEEEIKLSSPKSNTKLSKKMLSENIYETLSLLNIHVDSISSDNHEDIYFDTEDYLLYSTNSSLRVRCDENRLILKENTIHLNLSLCRTEHWRYLDKKEDIQKAANKLFHEHVYSADLYKVLTVHLRRESIYISTGNGKYQICIDEYDCNFMKYNCVNTYLEVEIETIQTFKAEDKLLAKFIHLIINKCKLINIFQSKYQIGVSTNIDKEDL